MGLDHGHGHRSWLWSWPWSWPWILAVVLAVLLGHGAQLWCGGSAVWRAKNERGRIRVPALVCFAQILSDFRAVGCRRGALKALRR